MTGLRLVFGSLLLCACAPAPETQVALPAPGSLPNVVVILLDTTRADHMGPFSDIEPSLTPFIDKLAEGAVVFENAWTAATATAPSTASVFTGMYPARHGLEFNILAWERPEDEEETFGEYLKSIEMVALPSSVPTLTEQLSRVGYQTIGIGANPNFCDELGFDRGFDRFSEHSYRDAPKMARELRRLSRGLEDDAPTFTYLHFMDPHAPYHKRRPHVEHSAGAPCSGHCKYKSELAFVDMHLERIFEETGWLEDDNTLIVLLTDHGEEFQDHGDQMHRHSVYQELARCGLLVRAPGVAPRRSQIPAHHTDILPTILEFAGLPVPDDLDGFPLLPRLDDAAALERPLLTVRRTGSARELNGLTFGRWRLLHERSTDAVELYDIAADPLEKNDLAAECPEVVADLRARLESLRAGLVPVPFEHVTVDLTAQLNRELQALGYGGGDGDDE